MTRVPKYQTPSRRALTFLVLLTLGVTVSCAKLARKKLEDRDLAFDADTMVSVAGEGAVDDVKLFLAAGMEPDVMGRMEDSSADVTSLMAAAQGCHAEVARVLLAAGADAAWVSQHNQSLLHAIADGCADAPAAKSREFATMLIDGGAEVDTLNSAHETPLLRALSHENVGIVTALVEHGADVRKYGRRGMSAIEIAREDRTDTPIKAQRHKELARIVEAAAARATAAAASLSPAEARKRLEGLPYKFDKDGMVAAASRNDIEALHCFFILDAPPEWRAEALTYATQGKKRDAMALLLSKGVKPNVEVLLATIHTGDLLQLQRLVKSDVNLDSSGRSGSTPLTAAAGKGWFEAVEILLEAGAKPDAQDAQGRTPLMAAAQAPTLVADARTVVLLVSRGVQVNAADSWRDGPAYHVAARGNARALQALVDAGANIDGSGQRGSVFRAAIGSQANSAQKAETLAVLYGVVDRWNETERIARAKAELSWIASNTAVNGTGMNPGNRSAQVTIGGSGQYDRISEDRLIDACHEIVPNFGLGCCWLERVDAYSAGGAKLGEFRFDRIRGWSFVSRR